MLSAVYPLNCIMPAAGCETTVPHILKEVEKWLVVVTKPDVHDWYLIMAIGGEPLPALMFQTCH